MPSEWSRCHMSDRYLVALALHQHSSCHVAFMMVCHLIACAEEEGGQLNWVDTFTHAKHGHGGEGTEASGTCMRGDGSRCAALCWFQYLQQLHNYLTSSAACEERTMSSAVSTEMAAPHACASWGCDQ